MTCDRRHFSLPKARCGLVSSAPFPHKRSSTMTDEVRAAKPSVFRVMLGETGWMVREDGGPTTPHSTRAEAVRAAQRLAQARPVARVIVRYVGATVDRQILFHGEPRAVRTFRGGDLQRLGARSTE